MLSLSSSLITSFSFFLSLSLSLDTLSLSLLLSFVYSFFSVNFNKDFAWITIKSRPLLKLTCDNDDDDNNERNSISYDDNRLDNTLTKSLKNGTKGKYCLISNRTRNIGKGLIKLSIRGLKGMLQRLVRSFEHLVNLLLNGEW